MSNGNSFNSFITSNPGTSHPTLSKGGIARFRNAIFDPDSRPDPKIDREIESGARRVLASAFL